MRELNSLIGLQVIATREGKCVGTVADALVDLAAGKLVALTLAKTPELRVVLADDISVIGPDAVMIPSSDRVKSREESAEALSEARHVLGDPPAVITTRGARVGQLGAVYIDEGSRRIVRFEVSSGPLKDVTEGTLALPVVEGIVHGEDTIIVPHEVVARRLEQAGGLKGALRGLAQRLRMSYEQVSDRSEELLHESGEKLKVQAEEARKRAAAAAREAREKAAQLAEEAKEKAGTLAEEVKEKAGQLAEEAKEKGSEPAEETNEAVQRVPSGMATEDGAAAEEGGEQKVTALVAGPSTPLPAHLMGVEGVEDAGDEKGAQEPDEGGCGGADEDAATDDKQQ